MAERGVPGQAASCLGYGEIDWFLIERLAKK